MTPTLAIRIDGLTVADVPGLSVHDALGGLPTRPTPARPCAWNFQMILMSSSLAPARAVRTVRDLHVVGVAGLAAQPSRRARAHGGSRKVARHGYGGP